jgi:hypothetical protein
MVIIEFTKKTAIESSRKISLSLPLYAWQMLEARAKTCYDGNLNKCIEEMFKERLFPWITEAIKTTTTMN